MVKQNSQLPDRRHPLNLAAISAWLCLCAIPATAGPVAPVIAHGTAGFNASQPGRLNITNTPSAIINWQGFSIARNEVTRFIQSSASSAVLNRVVGQDLSRVMGQLISKGRVYLINPNGIIFGPGTISDMGGNGMAGFIASTMHSNNGFIKGTNAFDNLSAPDWETHGLIHEGKAGAVLLLAPDDNDDGVLHNAEGDIMLEAGKALNISNLDAPEIRYNIQASGDQALNLEKMLTGDAVDAFAGTLTGHGEIGANALKLDAAGNIVLEAQDAAALKKPNRTGTNGD